VKDNEYYIITDKNGKPMSWGGEQLVFCDKDMPVTILTYNEAHEQIGKTIEFRIKNRYFVDIGYKLMPVKFGKYVRGI